MLVKFSFKFILGILEVIIPLGWEKLEKGGGKHSFVLQLLDAGEAFVVAWVGNNSGES